jgi:hypothetical protein
MSKIKILSFTTVLLLLISGCFGGGNDVEIGLDIVPEAESYEFTNQPHFTTSHKEPGSYTGTKRVRSIQLLKVGDMERFAFSIISENMVLEEFPSVEIFYDEENLVLTLDIYAGSPEFPVLWNLDKSELIENPTVETLNFPGQHGLVNIFRRLTFPVVEPIEYRFFWSETHNSMILDIIPTAKNR